MTESEKAEQDVAAARVIERVAKWKAMEAKASYYHYASKAMEASEASAEVMGARIRRDKMIAAEFADKAFANSTAQAPTTVSDSGEGEDDMEESCTYCGSRMRLDDVGTCMTDDGWQCPKCTASAEEHYASIKADTALSEAIAQPQQPATPIPEAILGGPAPFVEFNLDVCPEAPDAQIQVLHEGHLLSAVMTNEPAIYLSHHDRGYYNLGVLGDYRQRGVNDRAAGESIDACPFGEQSLAGELWRAGWMASGEAGSDSLRTTEPEASEPIIEQSIQSLSSLPTPEDDLEARLDSAVFGHGINAELDAREDKRSWLGLFGGKKLAEEGV